MGLSAPTKPTLYNYSEASKVLGLTGQNDRKIISLLARELGIKPKPMPNGKMKGLYREDLLILAKALNKDLVL